jgi:hypothetical membrane protein
LVSQTALSDAKSRLFVLESADFAAGDPAKGDYPLFTYTGTAPAIPTWTLGTTPPGMTAVVFNLGLVASGILFAVFATGLFPLLGKSVIGKVGAAIFVLACVALICIGVFNEHFSPTHYIVSVMLFVLLPISLLILTGAFWLTGKRGLSVFTLVLALVAATPWILEFTVHYVSGVAIPEFVSGLAGAAWTMVLSNKMLKEASRSSSA